jgi:hypothetical protein
MAWSIAGKRSAPHGFWMNGGSAEGGVYCGLSFGASSGEFRCRSGMIVVGETYDEGRRCWARPLAKKHQSLVLEFFCVACLRTCRHVLDCALGFANGLLSITLCLLRSAFCTQPLVAESLPTPCLTLPAASLA